MQFSRRSFLAGMAAAATATAVPTKAKAARRYSGDISPDSYATLIDLTKCDGCPGKDMAACVSACRTANVHKFPEPDPAMLKPYWPQNFYDDWSDRRDVHDRLTPYNWIFVQHIAVTENGHTEVVHVPRRCMHCDNPPCAKLCPFGVKHKHPEGMVTIDPFLCFGGSKCKSVCPWHIPQRQAGVGIYTHLDPLPAGGGVMFKCDLCKDRLDRGEQPACIPACPKDAMTFGARSEIDALAEKLAQEYSGYIYGQAENGGTSTVYVSRVSFEKMQQALMAEAKDPRQVTQLHRPTNMLDRTSGWAGMTLTAPVIGAVGAFAGAMAAGRKPDAKQQKPTANDTTPSQGESTHE